MMRTRIMGTNGLGAASMGWVLVGCIAFGFGVGQFLDSHFGTKFWMPVMVLVGVAAGFREMFRTLTALNRDEQRRRAEARGASTEATARPVSDEFQSRRVEGTAGPDDEGKTDSVSRQRIFQVPAPPLPSYMGGTGKVTTQQDKTADEDSDEIIERLLKEDDESDESNAQ